MIDPTNQPIPKPDRLGENSPEYRAAVVAGIRALADLIESRTDLPVPNHVGGQYTVLPLRGPDTERIVREVAANLGVDTEVGETFTSATLAIAKGGWQTGLPWFSVDYVVHGGLPTTDAEGGEQS